MPAHYLTSEVLGVQITFAVIHTDADSTATRTVYEEID
jgi:hypothetical protein